MGRNVQPYVGRWPLTGKESETLGYEILPGCNHMWRTTGPCAEEASSYSVNLGENSPKSQLFALALQGDEIVRAIGGLYHALVNAQGREMRKFADQIVFAQDNHILFPTQYPAVADILNHGFMAVYDRGIGVTPRVRGLPYNQSCPDQTILIASKLWKDIHAQRIFGRSTLMVASETPIEAKSTTTVEKKNHGCTISTDRSVLSGAATIC